MWDCRLVLETRKKSLLIYRGGRASCPFPATYSQLAPVLLKAHAGSDSKLAAGFDYIFLKVDNELVQTTLCCGIIPKDGGKSVVSQRLWEALTQRLTGSRIIAQPVAHLVSVTLVDSDQGVLT